jgi:hypothetical protein
MSQYQSLSGPWDEDPPSKEEANEMDLFDAGGGDSKMSLPTQLRSMASGPMSRTDPVMPTKVSGKKKRTSAAAELTPHGPRAGLSSAGPALSSPVPSLRSHAPLVSTPAPAALAPTHSPVVEPVLPPEREHTGNLLDMLARTHQILSMWSSQSWELARDQMHVARAVSALVSTCCQSGWHTLPHEDIPDAGTLLLRMHHYISKESPKTPDTTHSPADKAAHAPSKASTAPTPAHSVPKALAA